MNDVNDETGQDQVDASAEEQQEDAFDEEMAEAVVGNAVAEESAGELNGLLDAARKKADEHYEQLMRAHAEIENLKRRHAQEIEKAHKFALDKFVAELLGVRDSLELGHAAALDEGADVAKLREGTELTLKMLSDVMGKFGVEQVDPVNDTFNPDFHQAMAMIPRDDVPPNTVVDVIQKGYLLNGRLVRPALVAVSQAPPGS